MKRRNQIRRAKRRYRLRQRAVKAAVPTAPQPALEDPVWGDPAPGTPQEPPAAAAESPAAGTRYSPRIEVDKDGNVTVADPAGDPEHEPTEKPKPDYIRRAALMPKGSSQPRGPLRGGESASSWERPEDRNPTSVPVDWDRDPWEN